MKVRYISDYEIEIIPETDFEKSFIGHWSSICTHMDNKLETSVDSIGINITLIRGAKEAPDA